MKEINEPIERAFKRLESYGVPRERARSVANGISVLVDRMDKEANCYIEVLNSFNAASAKLFALIDEAGPSSEAQADRVFAQYEFDELRKVVERYKQLFAPRNENVHEKLRAIINGFSETPPKAE